MSKPQGPTPFGAYVKATYGRDWARVSEELKKTTSYLRMLASGKATPKLGFALVIDEWSKGAVTPRGWKPWCGEFSDAHHD